MKSNKYLMILMAVLSFTITAYSQNQTEPWTAAQLMQPEKLAVILNDSTATQPLIINVGPVNSIKGAIKIGPAKEKENLNELKKLLSKEDKNKLVVIYCGCCPFKDCPNIRPAFLLLTQIKFENAKLLNLPHNLKVDWINHDYPMTN
jgi:thiosulfate/3-mercaptopyruvate sulfurtransferase